MPLMPLQPATGQPYSPHPADPYASSVNPSGRGPFYSRPAARDVPLGFIWQCTDWCQSRWTPEPKRRWWVPAGRQVIYQDNTSVQILTSSLDIVHRPRIAAVGMFTPYTRLVIEITYEAYMTQLMASYPSLVIAQSLTIIGSNTSYLNLISYDSFAMSATILPSAPRRPKTRAVIEGRAGGILVPWAVTDIAAAPYYNQVTSLSPGSYHMGGEVDLALYGQRTGGTDPTRMNAAISSVVVSVE